MLPRTLEPEIMETAEEAEAYDLMNHQEVNLQFVTDLLTTIQNSDRLAADATVLNSGDRLLDLGTGNAAIPILLLQRCPQLSVIASDLSAVMLEIAGRHRQERGLQAQLQLICCDSCRTELETGSIDVVFSNSLIHHLPEPLFCFQEIARLLKPGGLMFVRDLLRPESPAAVEVLVSHHAGNQTPLQQQLLRQSLHAALRPEEVNQLLTQIPQLQTQVTITSDRHWTISGLRK